MKAPQLLRAYYRADETSDDGPLHFVASTADAARDGLVIAADAWELDNYRKNPVVLWVHDYSSFRTEMPVIGRAENVEMVEAQLETDIVFDPDDDFAQKVERKYRKGYLHAVSVGWDTLDITPATKDTPPTITRADLLDISAVPVPADPNALVERQLRLWRTLGLIPGDTPTPSELEARAGAVLSARNKELLEKARDAITNVLKAAEKSDDDDDRSTEENLDLGWLQDLSDRLAGVAPSEE